MKKIIVYGSKYGSTKLYAQKLSELTGVECQSYKQRPNLDGCDLIVYMGNLYGGRVNGLKKTAKHFPKNAKVILVTTGILDITVKDNYDYVKATSLKQLPNDIADNVSFYALMGKSDYGTMKWADKLIMNIVYKGMSQKPESERTQNEKNFIDNFKTVADMMNFDDLDQIAQQLSK